MMKIFVQSLNSSDLTYQKVIEAAGKPMLKNNLITKSFITACIKRETDFPTGLQVNSELGIAIPHGNPDLVKSSSISFVRLIQPVTFGRMDDKSQKVECSFIFNLALTKGSQHLTMLRTLMKLFQDKIFIENIKSKNIDDLNDYLYQKLV